jgi:hypothetical protein
MGILMLGKGSLYLANEVPTGADKSATTSRSVNATSPANIGPAAVDKRILSAPVGPGYYGPL